MASGSLVRHLEVPTGIRTIAVGGATLGGSGRTPLAIACARVLASFGARVVLVGHAYRARPHRARTVGPEDPLSEVGDEALLAARELSNTGASVVVAPRRADAVALAARSADAIVLDGVAQMTPVRASLALLAVDAIEPWGAVAHVPPTGNLRAPVDALRSACDAVVAIRDPVSQRIGPVVEGCEGWWSVEIQSRGLWSNGSLLPWDCAHVARIGLVCASARPDRIQRFLEARGLTVHAIVREPDHGPMRSGPSLLRALARAERLSGVDMWLASTKCAIHLDAAARKMTPSLPCVSSIDFSLSLALDGKLIQRLRGLGSP